MIQQSTLDAAWLLEIEQVSVVRGPVRILDRLSLRIPRATHTVILGPNGSGKTSLLKLLFRQFYPSVDEGHTGEVRIFGQSVWNVAELRQRLGIVSGELDHEFAAPRSGQMTALEAVLSGLDGVRVLGHLGQHGAADCDQASEALRRSGAEALEHRTLKTMSTGERRRVLIARALIHRPEALVLDEPTTGLDVAARHRFLDQLEQIAAGGTTVVLVTHHAEEIIAPIQYCIMLNHGRVFAEGSRVECLTDDKVSELFGYPLAISADGRKGRLRMEAR